ncbi:uncharacterized protein LOC115371874 [Myripristis murdjan]|uniref:uncharacterized protein LOC115371874 n=1 Tax=Myripristis murdjan TaxID=586833 RepID=UPI001175D6F8|nr:uncharacterized protein LOC115371874 [Myripristis murdjan]
MGRLMCQRRSRRDGRAPPKGDTPLKTGLIRGPGKFRRLLPRKQYETLQEEPLLDDTNILTAKTSIQILPQTSRKTFEYQRVVCFKSPVFAENTTAKNVPSATPASHNGGYHASMFDRANQMNPDPETFKKEEQSLTLTLESIVTSGTQQTTSVSSDNDEEHCYSSSSYMPSTVLYPSPEIFRRENCVESTFQMTQELLDLHPQVKNSTLLDASCAENIYMHQPPNMSTILDASVCPDEKEHEIRGTEAEPRRCTESFKSGKAPKMTIPKLTNRKPIHYKKKVRFKSPMVAESIGPKNIPAAKLPNEDTGVPVLTSSPVNLMTTDADMLEVDKINIEDDTKPWRLTLTRPATTSPEQATFFDFASDSDRAAFFQRLRDRYSRLRSAPLFPLEAVRPTEPSFP